MSEGGRRHVVLPSLQAPVVPPDGLFEAFYRTGSLGLRGGPAVVRVAFSAEL
jgi:hypothetical protein